MSGSDESSTGQSTDGERSGSESNESANDGDDGGDADGCRRPVRLTFPAELAHAALVRSCLRDVIDFAGEDDESRFLLAVTEVVVNAIEAAGVVDDHGTGQTALIEMTVTGQPPDAIEVRDAGGGLHRRLGKLGHLGVGLTIAEALVPAVDITVEGEQTCVRLGLEGFVRAT